MIYKLLVFLLVSQFAMFSSQGRVRSLAREQCLISCSPVFVEQPCCQSYVLAPIETQVLLRCSVIVGYRIEWGVTLPDQTGEYITDLSGVLDTLRARGIVVKSPDNETSLLVINATESTNGTAATCIAINRNNELARNRSRQVQVLYYGSPSTPTNLMATENGVGSLRISWSSSLSIEGVFHFVLIYSINNNSRVRNIVTGTQEHYIFTVEDSSPCDVYTFQVTALNAAGPSGPSELTRSLPSLPDISAVEDSLEQSLVKTADGVTLSVMFQGITSCPEYPVTSYTLVLVDSEGNETRQSSAVTSGEITLVVDGLMEDSLYSYYIVATNMIGDSVTHSVHTLVTSDALGVNSCIYDDSINLQCSYITGSDAHGCVYTLVSGVEGVANITGTIERSSSEGVQIDLPNVDDFVELLVFDWERDNSTGTVSVRAVYPSNTTCNISAPQDSTTDSALESATTLGSSGATTLGSSDDGRSLSILIIVIIIAAPFLLFLVSFLCTIISCYKLIKRREIATNDDNTNVIYDTVNEVISAGSPPDVLEQRNQEMVEVRANPSYGVREVEQQNQEMVEVRANPSYGVREVEQQNQEMVKIRANPSYGVREVDREYEEIGV